MVVRDEDERGVRDGCRGVGEGCERGDGRAGAGCGWVGLGVVSTVAAGGGVG